MWELLIIINVINYCYVSSSERLTIFIIPMGGLLEKATHELIRE